MDAMNDIQKIRTQIEQHQAEQEQSLRSTMSVPEMRKPLGDKRIYIQTGCSGTGRSECIHSYKMDAVWRIPVYRSWEGSENSQAAVFELAE